MKVGIYNRWLATLGGGEKHSLAIAEFMAKEHSVSVISHKDVSKVEAERRLNLDLSEVEFISIRERPALDITPLTASYDFFINASYLDSFPSHADRSSLLIYFPGPIDPSPRLKLRRQLALILKQWLWIPAPISGVFHIEQDRGDLIVFTGPNARFRLPSGYQDYELSFKLSSQSPNDRAAVIILDGHVEAKLDLPQDGSSMSIHAVVTGDGPKAYHELSIEIDKDNDTEHLHMDHAFSISDFEIHHPRYQFFKKAFRNKFSYVGARLFHLPTRRTSILESVDTYDAIWANSEYTKRWIKRYWDRESEVLYPPVDVNRFRPSIKRKQILTVGRFFSGSHNKKHREMVATFRQMVDQGLEGWSFHLAGGTTPGKEHINYLEKVRTEAGGYPIEIHPNISFDELARLYSESAIYWHAAGLGEDEKREPAKFEHFGITTVEAMSAGCVPIVIAKGGQLEIVENGISGYLWHTLSELIDRTVRLIRDSDLRQKMASEAAITSEQYAHPHFRSRLQKLLDQKILNQEFHD